jgi:hypothetical protein
MNHLSDTENQIQNVLNFQELISTPFQGEINAIYWDRELKGDFTEIVNKITLEENMMVVNTDNLLELNLSKQGQVAREILLNDLKLLKEYGTSPTLNSIKCYDRDDAFPLFPTDVYSFHVDRSPIPTDTFLCTYHGTASDIISNSEATQKILIPEVRSELKKLYGGSENGFESFLSEFFFDLHYQPKPNSNPINLGKGHLWKLAIDHPESNVLPCLHRAPKEKIGEPRLMMIC